MRDGEPVQNYKKLHKAYNEVGCRTVPIHDRSLDNNPVENVFHNVQNKLRTDAWEQEIENEPYEKFCEKVCSTLLNFSTIIMDRTIESMPNRMNLLLAGKGHRTKYEFVLKKSLNCCYRDIL